MERLRALVAMTEVRLAILALLVMAAVGLAIASALRDLHR